MFVNLKGNDFPIEYLNRGAVINHNVFLFEHATQVPIQCITPVQVLILSKEKVAQIRKKNEYSSINKELEMLTDYYERNGIERLHLDYILKAPFILEVNEE